MFHLSEEAFWRVTPRKFRALCNAYVKLNSADADPGTEMRRAYIDQVLF